MENQNKFILEQQQRFSDYEKYKDDSHIFKKMEINMEQQYSNFNNGFDMDKLYIKLKRKRDEIDYRNEGITKLKKHKSDDLEFIFQVKTIQQELDKLIEKRENIKKEIELLTEKKDNIKKELKILDCEVGKEKKEREEWRKRIYDSMYL